ncbi:putative common central domain of tyrosinase family protein [Phaeomoniella chlamydospora]|uniref:Putative common central domain of tyrosinase family protein n=1 Tax=Phaeomoniella chlamydospora TaxID=158046 RepID=A0A0G2GGI6_PHACM|nr:putative common central domain of tyrosinase family protein [Phaeomoniella chlamydospora]
MWTDYSQSGKLYIQTAINYHTSATVRWDKWFGYAYPEVVDWNVNATTLASNVRAKVNQLYNPSAGKSSKKTKRVATRPSRWWKGNGLGSVERVNLKRFHELDVNNLEQQWIANLNVDKHVLNASFNIDVFLGNPPANKDDWPLATNLLGTFVVLSSAGASPMGNEVQKFGQIQLTASLASAVSNGVIADLSEASVIPLLKSSLQAHLRARNGESIEDLSSLVITISSRKVTPASSIYDFPGYGDWVDYPEITEQVVTR